MKRHLARDASVDTGPRFEWLADDAKWRSAADFPLPAGAPLVAEGAGRLAINPADAVSGSPVAAGRAANAVNVPVPAPPAAVQAVGAPTLKLTYIATGAPLGGLRVRADRRRDPRRRRRQPGAPDPARARRQAAHGRAPPRGDRREPDPAVEADAPDHGRQPDLRPGPHDGRPPDRLGAAGDPDRRGGRRRRRDAARLAPVPVAAQLRDPPARAQAGPAAAARHPRDGRRQARDGVRSARPAARPGRTCAAARRNACV